MCTRIVLKSTSSNRARADTACCTWARNEALTPVKQTGLWESNVLRHGTDCPVWVRPWCPSVGTVLSNLLYRPEWDNLIPLLFLVRLHRQGYLQSVWQQHRFFVPTCLRVCASPLCLHFSVRPFFLEKSSCHDLLVEPGSVLLAHLLELLEASE